MIVYIICSQKDLFDYILVTCFILTIQSSMIFDLIVKIMAEKKTIICDPMSQHRVIYEQSLSGPHAFTKLSNHKIL